jgi:hypothetical protein
MKPWQLAIGLLGGGIAAVLGFKAVRAATAAPLALRPPPSPSPDDMKPLEPMTPKADPTDTYNVKTGSSGVSAAASPIPANALPYFLSGADGSFAYYVPAEPPKDRTDLFTVMADAPTVGVKAAAVVAFFHGKGKDVVSILAPIPVDVESIDAGSGAIKVRSSSALVAASADPAVKDTPLPDGASWTVPSFAMLGVPSKAWFDSFTFSSPESKV